MAKSGEYSLRFLESAENVKSALKGIFGRSPNAEVARGVSICLQQGRMYFDAASDAPTEIRPLLLYYGMTAFAKAIIVGRNFSTLATLKQSHGLRDISDHDARLEDLRVAIEGNGICQTFNDTVCALDGVRYFEETSRRKHAIPTARSADLNGKTMSLKDILARMPSLGTLYHDTFREKAKALFFNLYLHGGSTDEVDLRVDVPELFTDRASLHEIIVQLRAQYSALRRWRLGSAVKAWDNSVLTFNNLPSEGINEFAEDALVSEQREIPILAPRRHINRFPRPSIASGRGIR